jgi:2-oxoglutarate ferredoxin oxidoreductase subunit gamma
MKRVEIKIGGFGGQGVIMAGQIIGHAGAIYDGKEATLTQSFGPEARGGSCSAQVVISASRNLYPCVTNPDILMVMSQPAYDKYGKEMRSGTLLLFEESIVKPTTLSEGVKAFGIPATRLAEELGRTMVLNIVMVGFFAALSNVLTFESLKKSVVDVVPRGTQKLNLEAFERGYSFGRALQK